MYSPQLFFRVGSWSLLLYFRPASRVCGFDGALVALLRPVAPFTPTLVRSALGRFFGRWYFTYQRFSPGAVDRADYVPALLWQVIVGFPCTPGYLHIQADLFSVLALVAQSSRLYGRWFLAHWRYSQRSWPVVSPAVALNSTVLAHWLPRPSSYRRVTLRPSESLFLKLPRRHKTQQSPTDALAGLKPPINLSLVL